eukprot:86026-Prymnesium_polylepis.2
MHCSPKNQYRLASMMVKHSGQALLGVRALALQTVERATRLRCELSLPRVLQYDELVATGRTTSLSPLDLSARVLVKGKVKLASADDAQARGSSTSQLNSDRLSSEVDRRTSSRGSVRLSLSRGNMRLSSIWASACFNTTSKSLNMILPTSASASSLAFSRRESTDSLSGLDRMVGSPKNEPCDVAFT